MPGLNLPDLSPGFVDIGALMSTPMPSAERIRGPAPVEVPDYVPDPQTFTAQMAAHLLKLGGNRYAEYAKRLAPLSEMYPRAVYVTLEQGYTQGDINRHVSNYGTRLPELGSGLSYAMSFEGLPEGHLFWAGLFQHLSYDYNFPEVDFSALPPIPTKQWEMREFKRLTDGTYFALPWADDLDAIPRHYAHISTADPTMVSYTPDDAKGVADRQVRIKPGRYLAKFYPDMDPDDVRKYAAMLDASFTQLHIADTEDEIERVYTNGPSSCMSYSAPSFSSPCHPARVYAAGDLAVAYTTKPNGTISGRCLVWPEKKLRGRIYGDIDRMKLLLKGHGYDMKESDLEGARLLKMPTGDGYVMPYIDNTNSFGHHPDGKHLQIGGPYDATHTNGLSCGGTWCPYYEEYVDADEDDFVYITNVGESWSPRAAENHAFYCDRNDNHYSNDHGAHDVIVPSRWSSAGRTTATWSTSAVASEAWLCDATEEYLSDEIAGVKVEGVGTVDPEWAAENCTACHVSGDLYPTDQLVEDKHGNLVHPDHLEEDATADAA